MVVRCTQTLPWAALAVGLALSPCVSAEVVDCVTSSAEELPAVYNDTPNCDQFIPVSEKSWSVGIGAGYGERSNPLINSDDIPMYGILQLSWTGEQFFFDNGDFGLFLDQGKSWELNLIAGVGGERSFFSFLNSSVLSFIPETPGLKFDENSASDGMDVPVEGSGPEPIETISIRVKPPERHYTVDGGLEFIYKLGSSDLQIQALTDISGRHNGQELWFSWAYPLQTNGWQFVPSLGFTWKSNRTANYFYGVREDESSSELPAYQTRSATNPFVRLSASYRFNEHWRLVSVLQYEHLDSSISNSPSVIENHISTSFVGIYYEF
ncbi:MAG: outer membrane protein [Halieaceae bacterium]|jgi:outer membrane protein